MELVLPLVGRWHTWDSGELSVPIIDIFSVFTLSEITYLTASQLQCCLRDADMLHAAAATLYERKFTVCPERHRDLPGASPERNAPLQHPYSLRVSEILCVEENINFV